MDVLRYLAALNRMYALLALRRCYSPTSAASQCMYVCMPACTDAAKCVRYGMRCTVAPDDAAAVSSAGPASAGRRKADFLLAATTGRKCDKGGKCTRPEPPRDKKKGVSPAFPGGRICQTSIAYLASVNFLPTKSYFVRVLLRHARARISVWSVEIQRQLIRWSNGALDYLRRQSTGGWLFHLLHDKIAVPHIHTHPLPSTRIAVRPQDP